MQTAHPKLVARMQIALLEIRCRLTATATGLTRCATIADTVPPLNVPSLACRDEGVKVRGSTLSSRSVSRWPGARRAVGGRPSATSKTQPFNFLGTTLPNAPVIEFRHRYGCQMKPMSTAPCSHDENSDQPPQH